MHSRTLALFLLVARPVLMVQAQTDGTSPPVPFSVTEEVGLPMNKAQLMAAVEQAWAYSFALEPGAAVRLKDGEAGMIEGGARVNYRSNLLMAREESMGVVNYQVTIQVRNGQCSVHVHDLRHTGNKATPGGGVHIGLLLVGDAPEKRYPGLGLAQSKRLHADIRAVAGDRVREVLRMFTARLRLLGGQ